MLNYIHRPLLICGYGNMGRRIATVIAAQGNFVHLYASSSEQTDLSIQYINEYLPEIAKETPNGKPATVKVF